MPKQIRYEKKLIRISLKKDENLEYSTTDGKAWNPHYTGSSAGDFIDLFPYGDEILAITSKGLYYSSNGGKAWNPRYTGSSVGEFYSLLDNGKELLAQTSKGLYYSTNEGRTWNKRG